jgi:hypothetical protein
VLSSPDEAITLRAASRGDAEIFWRYSPNNLDEALSSNVDHNKYQPIIVPSREWLEEKLKGVEQSFSISLVISLVPGQFDASTYVPHARIPSSSFSL